MKKGIKRPRAYSFPGRYAPIVTAATNMATDYVMNNLFDRLKNNSRTDFPKYPDTAARIRGIAKSGVGRLGGKFKRGKRVRLFPKKRKYKGLQGLQKSLQLYQNKGGLVTRELGISTTGVSNSVYLGHATYARDRWTDCLVRAMIRKLLVGMDVSAGVKQWSDQIGWQNIAVGDTFALDYKVGQDSTDGRVSLSYTVVAAATWDDLVNFLWTGILQIQERDIIFLEFAYRNVSTNRIVKVDLNNATVDVYVKSSLKLQNTTISTGGTEADEVDNVPVSGKSYEGRGTGTISNRSYQTEQQFFGDAGQGLIHKVGTTTSGLSEMPPAGYFRNVSKVRTQRIDPGKIKYSNLVTRMNISLVSLANIITKNRWTDSHQINYAGKYRFFGFEHVIKATDNAPNIRIFGEINYRIGMYLQLKGTQCVDEKVTQGYFTY